MLVSDRKVMSCTYHNDVAAINGEIWSSKVMQRSDRGNAARVHQIAVVVQDVNVCSY
jgi:hypothetical protein